MYTYDSITVYSHVHVCVQYTYTHMYMSHALKLIILVIHVTHILCRTGFFASAGWLSDTQPFQLSLRREGACELEQKLISDVTAYMSRCFFFQTTRMERRLRSWLEGECAHMRTGNTAAPVRHISATFMHSARHIVSKNVSLTVPLL